VLGETRGFSREIYEKGGKEGGVRGRGKAECFDGVVEWKAVGVEDGLN
jgi:hypothetical protein